MVGKQSSDNDKDKGSFSSKSFTLESFHYVPSASEKITANVSGQQPSSLNISGEVKELEFKKSTTVPSQFNIVFSNYPPNSFNPVMTSNQSIFQYYSIEYILTFTSQQNISIECKTILQAQIKDFEQECKKSNPDQGKLKSILNYVCPIAKDLGLMLVKYGLDSGQLKF